MQEMENTTSSWAGTNAPSGVRILQGCEGKELICRGGTDREDCQNMPKLNWASGTFWKLLRDRIGPIGHSHEVHRGHPKKPQRLES